MTIDYEFFKKKMDYFLWLEKQQKAIEELFDCDIYGGPMKIWHHELRFWRAVLKSNEAYNLLVSFAPFYSSTCSDYASTFEYGWNDDDDILSYHNAMFKLNTVPSKENWTKAVWSHICELEGKVNE